jgi:ribosome maturation factor RimP
MTNFEKIQQMMDTILDGTDSYIVEAKGTPTHIFKFWIDADTGFNLQKSVKTTRALRNMIDESEMYPEGNYSLEIGSPGIDVPLKFTRQFVKNLEKLIEIVFIDKEQKAIIGRLKNATEETLEIEVTDKKKKTSVLHTINRAEIKTATIQIEF